MTRRTLTLDSAQCKPHPKSAPSAHAIENLTFTEEFTNQNPGGGQMTMESENLLDLIRVAMVWLSDQ
jgi:hypothetical protein